MMQKYILVVGLVCSILKLIGQGENVYDEKYIRRPSSSYH